MGGVAVFTQDGDAVFLGVARGLRGPRIRLGAVRREGYNQPLADVPLAAGLERPVALWLERVAGHVVARYQVEGGAVQELLPEPLPFPVLGQIGGALFAEEHFTTGSRAFFSAVEISAPEGS